MANMLVMIGSAGAGTYARYRQLSKLTGLNVDLIWLDRQLSVKLSDTRTISQRGTVCELSSYDLIIYWPASYQALRHRIGSWFPTTATEEYLSRSWRVVEDAIFSGLDHLMLNSYRAACDAANKGIVYLSALANDISMPTTIITNRPGRSLTALSTKQVIKTVTDTVDVNDDLQLYTSQYPTDYKCQILDAPYIIQQYIKAICEYRAFYFDGRTIAVRVPRGDDLVDVRLTPGSTLKCEIVDNTTISRMASRLATLFHLGMFSADFLEDVAGKIYFIDLNPHGTWHWLQRSVRDRLDHAYIEMVLKKLGLPRRKNDGPGKSHRSRHI